MEVDPQWDGQCVGWDNEGLDVGEDEQQAMFDTDNFDLFKQFVGQGIEWAAEAAVEQVVGKVAELSDEQAAVKYCTVHGFVQDQECCYWVLLYAEGKALG